MVNHKISRVFPFDIANMAKVEDLLRKENIRLDQNLDYTCAIFNDDNHVIATGSYFGNSLRCLCVSSDYQGEGLLNSIVSHLIAEEYAIGNFHLFVYTKTCSSKFLKDLGFTEIVRIDDKISFLENKKTGFQDYLSSLERPTEHSDKIAALVINANPFTLGHQYLVEKAAAENDIVHLFMVSEDKSLVPSSVRQKLIISGLSHLNNIIFHETGPYLISQATFPSYFQKEESQVIESQALLDTEIFLNIAKQLGITKRYVGEEPSSQVTAIYNDTMAQQLKQHQIELVVVPRKMTSNQEQFISASTARLAIKEDNWQLLETLVPKTTLDYFQSDQAKAIINKIKKADNVVHH
ncbi:[citrate (pro-3S)-lyase] ligase [Streptococcus sp. ZJ151]|uniref:[citrate (pro-3S)-lyase] ligase n=1 Tax=Streptococcus jiangjianxini TaxID=3161189 RepID=UPI0032EDEC1A